VALESVDPESRVVRDELESFDQLEFLSDNQSIREVEGEERRSRDIARIVPPAESAL